MLWKRFFRKETDLMTKEEVVVSGILTFFSFAVCVVTDSRKTEGCPAEAQRCRLHPRLRRGADGVGRQSDEHID